MLQITRLSGLRALKARSRSQLNACAYTFSSSVSTSSTHPNPPLNLDPSMQALLKDVDMSLLNYKPGSSMKKELEVFPDVSSELTSEPDYLEDIGREESHRKSPAALFGSQQIGAVVIPTELQSSINVLIAEADRPLLHSDAKRLFLDKGEEMSEDQDWGAQYDAKYRSRRQTARHAERDGTAFASIALPAHYSAIISVFDHLKHRLDSSWEVERVIDWGAGAGSGLWFVGSAHFTITAHGNFRASLYSFQSNDPSIDSESHEHFAIANSTVKSYLGVEKREGLVTIGKRLFKNVEMGQLSMCWQKSFKEDDRVRRIDGDKTLALSAFMLSSLSTPLARKQLVKEMWESGAHTIILIDHNTKTGFEMIAEAREYLLNVGRKEFEDPEAVEWPIRGSHVVAPCPHDHICPLFHPGSTRLVCGFSQRIQRPKFVRRTKHSGVGHEDIEYSYVVIRRGPRPPRTTTSFGRLGEVGRRAIDKERMSEAPLKELQLHDEQEALVTDEEHAAIMETPMEDGLEDRPKTLEELRAALRKEAYQWPRLVFPPLKKSGHIILDSCTAEGKIMRLTIPKSQGKQPFYDARKSSWGDLFPHPPKNTPQERFQPIRAKRPGGTTAIMGSDIGKRRQPNKQKDRATYEDLSESIKETRKKSKRDWNRTRELPWKETNFE
ncbi:mitochondrial small ribosomal subunit Rsm22-domain-containing protein [Crucibulum laeve]|uniref:Mitochondrial small ribosomal subunit Rsm22-domain-containing protein n=1 Tax=Crucibulum laeve TaxID=68775 RepID=A0A5C3M9I9_9AGAR|nr:mitochondrial small ribosomal subunit Rsm22-domain-containing protein [Crucibulum laeve]